MNTFPAQPGTLLRQYDADGDYVDTPIIGWQHVSGNLCFPVFPVGQRSVGPGSILVIPAAPEGPYNFVHFSSQRTTTDDDVAASWAGEALSAAEENGEVPTVTTKTPTPVQPDGKPDTRPLKFGAATYKTKSFWHWPSANAVFDIEPNNVIPSDPRVIKVKRDEQAKLKRDGAVKIDPHSGLIIAGEHEEPTPEEAAGLKATSTGFVMVEDEDEEDIAGLI